MGKLSERKLIQYLQQRIEGCNKQIEALSKVKKTKEVTQAIVDWQRDRGRFELLLERIQRGEFDE